LGVDAAVKWAGCPTASKVQELIAVQHALWALDKCKEESIFARAQRHTDPIIAQQLTRLDIQGPSVKAVSSSYLPLYRVPFQASAPEHGSDTSDELTAAEGLR
jgi:hypothetical protein